MVLIWWEVAVYAHVTRVCRMISLVSAQLHAYPQSIIVLHMLELVPGPDFVSSFVASFLLSIVLSCFLVLTLHGPTGLVELFHGCWNSEEAWLGLSRASCTQATFVIPLLVRLLFRVVID